MGTIRKKLNSENGATLVMAMVYMLLCIVIGSMILSSGSTAMGQVHHLRGEEQSYLNVLSAAELIKDELQATFFVEEHIIITHTESCDTTDAPEQTLITYPHTNALTAELQVIYGDPSAEETFTIEASNLKLNDVSVTVRMREDFALIFVLTEHESLYALTLIMPAETNTAVKTDISTHEFQSPPGSENYTMCTRTAQRTTKTISFDLGTIHKGAH